MYWVYDPEEYFEECPVCGYEICTICGGHYLSSSYRDEETYEYIRKAHEEYVAKGGDDEYADVTHCTCWA